MAIAFDNSDKTSGTTVSSLTVSGFTVSGTNKFAIVGIFLVDTNSRTISSVTMNGVSMTSLYDYAPAATRKLAMFYLAAPASGNVVATFSGAVSNNAHMVVASYTGVKQTGNPEANNKNDLTTVSSVTTAVTTIANLAWLVGVNWTNDSATLAAGTNTTNRQTTTYGNAYLAIGDSNAGQTPAGSHSLQYSYSPGTTDMSLMVMSLSPAGNDFTLSLAQGSFTLTGLATNFLKSLRMLAVQGAYTLTGNAVTFVTGKGISLVTGIFSLIGNAVSLRFSGWVNGNRHDSTFSNSSRHDSNWTNEPRSS